MCLFSAPSMPAIPPTPPPPVIPERPSRPAQNRPDRPNRRDPARRTSVADLRNDLTIPSPLDGGGINTRTLG